MRKKLPALPGTTLQGLKISEAEDFAYTDPIDRSISSHQGIKVLFAGGSRIIYRLSGTGTSGATVRAYIERYEPAGGDLDADPATTLSGLSEASTTLARIEELTGRFAPDVAT